MRRMHILEKSLVVIIMLLIFIFLAFFIDINLAYEGKNPIFCFDNKQLEYENVQIYTGFGYRIIKYNYLENEYKIKFGFFSLKYDNNFNNELKGIDANGRIENISLTDKGIYKFKILSNYDKAIIYVNSSTNISKNEEILGVKDLKKGTYVEVKLKSYDKEKWPIEGIATDVYVID